MSTVSSTTITTILAKRILLIRLLSLSISLLLALLRFTSGRDGKFTDARRYKNRSFHGQKKFFPENCGFCFGLRLSILLTLRRSRISAQEVNLRSSLIGNLRSSLVA